MFYLDASAAVAAIAQEAHSEAIWRWLGDHADAPILCSGWTTTEVSSALSIKLRIAPSLAKAAPTPQRTGASSATQT